MSRTHFQHVTHPPSPTSSSAGALSWDWDRVHGAIQQSLLRARDSIRAEESSVVSKPGRTTTRAFPLFSFVVFPRIAGRDFDPVVVGVTVKPGPESTRITGDISGEESGDLYFDEGCELEVPLSPEEVIRGAVEVADRRASEWRVALAAIRSSGPQS